MHDLCTTSDGTTPWCATSVDENKKMKSWDNCSPDCPGSSKSTTPQLDFNFDNAPGNCCKFFLAFTALETQIPPHLVYNLVRLAINIKKVKVLLTLYGPLLPPTFYLVKLKLFALTPPLPKVSKNCTLSKA